MLHRGLLRNYPREVSDMADCVLVEKTEGVAILTLNRPEQLNAMNHQLNA